MVLCVIEHEQWARGLQMCVAIKKSKLTTKTQSCALPCRRTGLSRQMNATRWSVARWPGGQGGQLPPQLALKRGRQNNDRGAPAASKLHEMCLIKMIIYVV